MVVLNGANWDVLSVSDQEYELIRGKWENLIGKSSSECARVLLPLLFGITEENAAKRQVCFIRRVDGPLLENDPGSRGG